MIRNKDKKRAELLLLCELRRNGRRSITSISRALGMPVSTVHDRIKNNIGSNVKRFTCVLDYEKLGFGYRFQAALRVKNMDVEKVKSYLLKQQNVNSVYRINNGFNFLIDAVFSDLRESEDFLDKLDRDFRIAGKKVFYILEELSTERFLTDQVHAGLV